MIQNPFKFSVFFNLYLLIRSKFRNCVFLGFRNLKGALIYNVWGKEVNANCNVNLIDFLHFLRSEDIKIQIQEEQDLTRQYGILRSHVEATRHMMSYWSCLRAAIIMRDIYRALFYVVSRETRAEILSCVELFIGACVVHRYYALVCKCLGENIAWKFTFDSTERNSKHAYRRLSRTKRFLASGAKLDSDYRELLLGRSLVVVGPLQTDRSIGSEIDDYDLVVRPNYRQSMSDLPAELYGRRVDIGYYNLSSTTARESSFLADNHLLKFCCLSNEHEYSRLSAQIRTRARPIFRPDNLMFYGTSMGIPNIVYDLWLNSATRVNLVGVDLYVSADGGHEAYLPCSKQDLKQWSPDHEHDLLMNFLFMKKLYSLGAFSTPDFSLQEILSWPLERYVDALSRTYADTYHDYGLYDRNGRSTRPA